MNSTIDEMKGAGIAASANMWALLADDDPGDNQIAKHNRMVKTGAGDTQPVAEQAASFSDEKEQSSSVGDKKRKKKRKNKKKPGKKQKQERKSAVSANGGHNSDQFEDSDGDEEAAGASCFQALFLTLTAVTTALVSYDLIRCMFRYAL